MTWVYDDNGNRCSVENWGSKEEAKIALSTLFNCENCSDCEHCSDCLSCHRCSNCSGCSNCGWCEGCEGCNSCDNCGDCSDCYRCYLCNDCYDLHDNSRCSRGRVVILPPIAIPVIPDVHKAVYTAACNPGSLNMNVWHACENTHCRAGWIVTIAGEAGKQLEDRFGATLAAMMIYDASDPGCKFNPGCFFDSNEDALTDMKRQAGVG